MVPPSFRIGLLNLKSGEPASDALSGTAFKRLGCDVVDVLLPGNALLPKLMDGIAPMGSVKLVGSAGSSTCRK